MTLSLVGLGLAPGDLSRNALKEIERADTCYLETFTTASFTAPSLSKCLNRPVVHLPRESVESDLLINEAELNSIVLLVPGDPLLATTHYELIERARSRNIPTKVIHAPSIFQAVARSGISPYKLGRTVSLPELQTPYPHSPFDMIQKNQQSIGCHTLLLLDPSLSHQSTSNLLKANLPEQQLLALESAGTERERFCFLNLSAFETLTPKMHHPFSIILFGTLDHKEREYLARWAQ